MAREQFTNSIAVGLPSQAIVNQTVFNGPKSVSLTVVPTGIDKAGAVLNIIGSNAPVPQQATSEKLATITIANTTDYRNYNFSDMGYDYIFIQYTPGTETVGTFEITTVVKS